MSSEEEIIVKKDGVEVVLTEQRIRDLTSKYIELCGKDASIHDDFGMSAKMVDMLIKLKQVWYPATQKNLNLNVNAFDDKLKLWLKARDEMNKEKKEKLVVYDVK